jgi:hypothetical protein
MIGLLSAKVRKNVRFVNSFFQTVMNFFEAVVGGWHHIFSARMHHAKLWTQDAHFEGISGVSFIRKAGVESSI